MELEEAIEILKSYENKLVYEISEKDKEAVVVVLNHLTKQQKIINQMAEDRMLPYGCRTLYNVFNKQDVIDFYEKFVEESE